MDWETSFDESLEHLCDTIGHSDRRAGLVEAGRPLRMIVTEGQVSDIACAHELVQHLRTGAVIADKSL